MHTNYLEYAKREEGGGAKEVFMRHVNSLMCRFHCHKVVKLSGAVQDLPKSMTEFVHGVSPHFLAIGDRMSSKPSRTADAPTSHNKNTSKSSSSASHHLAFGSLSLPHPAVSAEPPSQFTKGVYFIGKVLWPKGYSELVELVNEYKQHGAQTGENDGVQMDVYGGGEDLPAVKQKSSDMGLDMTFLGPKDHGHEDIHQCVPLCPLPSALCPLPPGLATAPRIVYVYTLRAGVVASRRMLDLPPRVEGLV